MADKALEDSNLDPDNWKDRKDVWYKLKDDDEYNIDMCALILYRNAGGSLTNPTKTKIVNAAALYNASSISAGTAYGKKIYEYYCNFVKYNQ